MCGIVGVICKNIVKGDREIVKTLIELDTIRGRDSVGVFTLADCKRAFYDKGTKELKYKVPIIDKQIGTGFDYFNYYAGEKFLERGTDFIVAHNRAATVGSVTLENAHPFQYGNIIGVHNGTLYQSSTIKDFDKFDVDSKAMISSINDVGIEETYKNLAGAVSSFYYDGKNLNYFRNEDRPMCFAITKDRKKMFFSSDILLLKYALNKHIYSYSEDDFVFFEPKIDTLFTFSFEKDDVIGIKTKKLEPRTIPSYQNNYGGVSNYDSYKSIKGDDDYSNHEFSCDSPTLVIDKYTITCDTVIKITVSGASVEDDKVLNNWRCGQKTLYFTNLSKMNMENLIFMFDNYTFFQTTTKRKNNGEIVLKPHGFSPVFID